MSVLNKDKFPILSRYEGKTDDDLYLFFEGLTEDEQHQARKEAEEVGKILQQVFDGFSKAFAPVAEHIKQAVANIWESMPEETRAELLKRKDS